MLLQLGNQLLELVQVLLVVGLLLLQLGQVAALVLDRLDLTSKRLVLLSDALDFGGQLLVALLEVHHVLLDDLQAGLVVAAQEELVSAAQVVEERLLVRHDVLVRRLVGLFHLGQLVVDH